jgi:hypothetical protein
MRTLRLAAKKKDASHVPAGSVRKMSGTVSGILTNSSLSERKYSKTGVALAAEPSAKTVGALMPVTSQPSTPAPTTRTLTLPDAALVV